MVGGGAFRIGVGREGSIVRSDGFNTSYRSENCHVDEYAIEGRVELLTVSKAIGDFYYLLML